MILDKLPQNHFKVEEIVKVLKKHTAKKPTIDLQFMMDHLKYTDTARNFTVPVMTQGKDGKWESKGHVVAVIENAHDLEVLRWEVKETYKRITGEFVEPEKKVEAVTTSVDDLAGGTPEARPNKKSKAKYGKKIESGSLTVDNPGVAE